MSIQYCSPYTHYKNHYIFFVHLMLSSGALQQQLGAGWEFRFIDDPFAADLVVCQNFAIEQFLADTGRHRHQLVLGVEHHDSAYVFSSLQTLSRPEVFAMLKHHLWAFPEQDCTGRLDLNSTDRAEVTDAKTLEDLRNLDGRHYMETLVEAIRQPAAERLLSPLSLKDTSQLLASRNCRALPKQLFDKVHAIIPSWLTTESYHGDWLEQDVPPVRERPVDVTFVGSVPGEFRKAHRLELVDALQTLQERHREWNITALTFPLETSLYGDLLRRTKIFISPWGFGEWSGKDEESIFLGAVLMKPLAGLLQHIMPIYGPGVCWDVRPDWRDLEAVITQALSDTGKLQRMQEAGREALRPFRGYPAAVRSAAPAFARMLEEANIRLLAATARAQAWSEPPSEAA